MINHIIDRYKRLRSMRQLQEVCTGGYAFVGIGSHSVDNLYPVLDYLGVQLKHICCRSEGKLQLIEQKRHTHATTSLSDVLNDDGVAGVLVAAGPKANFSISKDVIASGKSLFVEKPPCLTLDELNELITLKARQPHTMVAVGLQKRYAPATQMLKQRLRKAQQVSYNLKYLTGLYPEGDALTDLFIHPLDLVCHLFGNATVRNIECVGNATNGLTLMVVLKHGAATGMLELSTAYSWATACEQLTVNTRNGIYEMSQMECLDFCPKNGSLCGVPLEKVLPRRQATISLLARNNFAPVQANNQIYTQGFYAEIKAFTNAVEGHKNGICSSLESLVPTYELLEAIKRQME